MAMARLKCSASETITAVVAFMASMIARASTKLVHVDVERVSHRMASTGTPRRRA
jgi:hypothetical protein